MAGPIAQGLLAARENEKKPPVGLLRGLSLSPYGEDGWQVPPMIQGLLSSAINGATAPGRALSGELQMTDPRTGRTSPEAIAAATDLAGLLTLGSGAIPAGANEMRMGIKAYHGSPYDFDRFDIGRVGTGEGASDLGRAIYLYDEMAPAELYRNPAGRWGDIKAMSKYNDNGPSRVYEVDINASPKDIIDADTLLKDLPKTSKLRSLMEERAMAEPDKEFSDAIRNGTKVSHLTNRDDFAQLAQEDGFKGVSRKRYGGETEMAIFDQNILEIVKKYGVVGALSMGAITLAQAKELSRQQKEAEFAAEYAKGNAT